MSRKRNFVILDFSLRIVAYFIENLISNVKINELVSADSEFHVNYVGLAVKIGHRKNT